MKLADLIRKNESVGVATATRATFATQRDESGGTVAGVATVAVANADETRIRAWLAHIGETHQPIIEEVMEMIATDPAALAYYMKRADEVPCPADQDVDRITRKSGETT